MEYQLPKKIYSQILSSQKNEITEHYIYQKLAQKIKNHDNSMTLLAISDDELRHYQFWKSIAHKEMKPSKFKIWFYYLVTKNFSFKKRFIEMAAISMGVALLTFGIGFLIRKTLGVDI